MFIGHSHPPFFLYRCRKNLPPFSHLVAAFVSLSIFRSWPISDMRHLYCKLLLPLRLAFLLSGCLLMSGCFKFSCEPIYQAPALSFVPLGVLVKESHLTGGHREARVLPEAVTAHSARFCRLSSNCGSVWRGRAKIYFLHMHAQFTRLHLLAR